MTVRFFRQIAVAAFAAFLMTACTTREQRATSDESTQAPQADPERSDTQNVDAGYWQVFVYPGGIDRAVLKRSRRMYPGLLAKNEPIRHWAQGHSWRADQGGNSSGFVSA